MGRRRTASAPGDLERGRQKGGFKEAFDLEVVREIEALIAPGAADRLDFEAVETAARRRALSVAARAVEQRLNADHTDHVGAHLRCSCGHQAHYAGRRDKRFTTALGDMVLGRAYYHCEKCEAGLCPRDYALGLAATSLSPAVARMNGQAAAMVSFAETHELLRDLAGVEVSTKQVERSAEALGGEIAEDERNVVEPATVAAAVMPTMYLGMDGTGVPMRSAELVGRNGKQPDGSSKTREVKLVTVWSAEDRDEQGLAVRDPGSVSYCAAIESAAHRDLDQAPAQFAQRVEREARRRGFDVAHRQVVLGDGALWIWNLADQHFPNAIQIVDLFHAKQHLFDVAKAIFGATSDLAEPWGKQRRDELDDGNLEAVLTALRAHAAAIDEARKCLEYFTRNRSRMRYPQFRAQGLCVSTGVVEAGCKLAIGTRCKRTGMHWTVAGVNAIIALRCYKLSGRFEDFWERRATAARTAA